ncbi:Leu/Phe/Val dehydrogenase [Paraburkholderia megapolitana]|uniref:Leucine dehydrogenase n=1 Tax=Paraburkholderia megapolitana TaxID=420953 RepID=A0A1I3LUV2_9BURK|nr:amino acid dehydrogenase [Paraburkholderia megapolitana]QDQ80860.1 amino acid dehydrogenase [Paraburkholderia megapolitana]SFI88529.1 leucine dehydrogenase [Paraburkholderia megapolitana]
MDRLSTTTAETLFGINGESAHERVVLATDAPSGLQAIIAVYSTARGPSFGGCRYWQYAGDHEALNDALRLSQGMAFKNALADLPFGGGKAVIVRSGESLDRAALFRAFGRLVQSLNGIYITAEDVGTTADDMRAVQSETQYVSGIPRAGEVYGGNPSPRTAYGVFVGLLSAVDVALGRKTLDGVSVAVQGLGSVGWDLCERLHRAGAQLIVADIDATRTTRARELFNARVVETAQIVDIEADVFAPCALGGSITRAVAAQCRFKVIAGGANNQLMSLAEGDVLHQRGIFYTPDFLVNAGGIISCVREYLGSADEQAVLTEIAAIGPRVLELADRVKATGIAPARAAVTWARQKMTAQ